jgi:hypothetical protein
MFCSSAARIPIALHVCKESCEEALRYYKLSFGLGPFYLNPGHVYFDFKSDVFFLNLRLVQERAARKFLLAQDVECVKKVAVCYPAWIAIATAASGSWLRVLGRFETVIVICPPGPADDLSRKDLVVDFWHGPKREGDAHFEDFCRKVFGLNVCWGILREERQ